MIDPHNPDRFDAKNLREDEWHEYQHHSNTAFIVFHVIDVFSREMIGRVSFEELDEIGLDVACKAGTPICMIQDSHHWFWASIAIAMLTHGRFEIFKDEQCVRFSKSPFENEPLYYNNIEYSIDPVKHWLSPRLKAKNEIKTTRAPGNRQDDPTFGISAKGVSRRNSSQQDLFPDLYESS